MAADSSRRASLTQPGLGATMNPASKRELSVPPTRLPSTTTSTPVGWGAPSGSESLESVASVASRHGPPVRPTTSSRSVWSARSAQSAQSVLRQPRVDRLPKKPTRTQKPLPPVRQVPKKIKTHPPAKNRKEGRVKVRYRDGFREFFFSSTGMLKVLRMCFIAASVFCFIIGSAQDVFIAITIQETCIVLFFIVVYLITLHHLLVCIHWPLLDLINSLISTMCLGAVGIKASQEKGRRQLCYTGGVLCLVAAILCLLDGFLVTRDMRNEVKNKPALKK